MQIVIYLTLNWILSTDANFCNMSLTSTSTLVDLGTNPILDCKVCNISKTSQILYLHNGTQIAGIILGLPTTDKSRYNITANTIENVFSDISLTIFNFSTTSLGTYTCRVKATGQSSSLYMSYKVAVESATMTPNASPISVLPNVPINYISCASSLGRPTPTITWYLDNGTPSIYSDDANLTRNSHSSTQADVTTSTLTLTPTSYNHDQRIYCNVSNGYGQIMSKTTLNINVLRLPTKPTVLYNKTFVTERMSVIENSIVLLECNSSGNPMPNISWTFLNNTVIHQKEIVLNLKQRDTQEQVSCSATSQISPTNGPSTPSAITTDLRVDMLYPPSIPMCAIGPNLIEFTTIRAVKNEQLKINCTSKSNPPPTSYTWTLPGGMKQYGQQLAIPQVVSSGTYTLDVNNVMNATFEPRVIIGNANMILTLEVLYPVTLQSIANTTVLLNQNLSVTCPYIPGNPPETSFTWTHVNTSRGVGRGQILELPNMQIAGEGLYKCKVNNTMTPTGCCVQQAYGETMFYVDVQYAANITRFYATGFGTASNITVNENQTVILHCDSEGDPLASMLLINNTRGAKDLLKENYYNMISASIPHARCEYDMGIYQCRANNTHNKNQQVREIEIKIKCAPRWSPFMPPEPKVWTKTNSSVILTYTIVAYPPPSAFIWWKHVNDKWLILNNTSRLHIHISQERLQTNLSILQVQEDDFANYTVLVSNDIGSSQQAFVIQAKEEPAMPNQFRILEELVTDKSVTVNWIPGFNGGDRQWFVIGYKQEVSKQWLYKNVSEDIHRKSIDGLVSGTSYQFKIYAENSIGTSKETDVILFLTRAKTDDGSSPSVGAAVGGAVGGSLVIVIFVVLWKYRHRFKRNPDAGAHYDDLFRGQTNVSAVNTSSEYAEYRVDSQHRNQYETLAETEFRQYSVLSTGGTEGNRVLNLVSGVSDNNCAVKIDDNVYVNLVLSKTET